MDRNAVLGQAPTNRIDDLGSLADQRFHVSARRTGKRRFAVMFGELVFADHSHLLVGLILRLEREGTNLQPSGLRRLCLDDPGYPSDGQQRCAPREPTNRTIRR